MKVKYQLVIFIVLALLAWLPLAAPVALAQVQTDDKSGQAQNRTVGETTEAASTAVVGQAPSATPAIDQAPSLPTGRFSVNASAEVGFRFFGASGSINKYRSDLDYGRGFRLFNLDYLMRAQPGQSQIIDTLAINASGWGGDP